MSKTIAEVLRETMRDHRVLWEIGLDEDSDLVAKCESCGYLSSELDTWEHQSNVAAEVLSAAGFGLVTDTKAEALREAAERFKERSDTYHNTMQEMTGSKEYGLEDIVRYGAYSAEANATASEGPRLPTTGRPGALASVAPAHHPHHMGPARQTNP